MTHEQLQAAQRAALSLGFNITSEVAVAVFQAMQASAPEAKPVAVVDCSDDACWADILDDVTVKVGQKLYAAPITLPTTAAARDVLAERQRQVEVEGWTPEHDDEHGGGELADAAACYALWAGSLNPGNWLEFWPWHDSLDTALRGETPRYERKPAWLKHSEPRRMLVKAGALILAEIERLDRAVPAEAPQHRTYTTQPGESLAGIALRQLKDESRWVEIRDLNARPFPDMGPHDYYPVGTVLDLPASASKEISHG